MSAELNSVPTVSIRAVAERILSFRQITPIDRQLLQTVLMSRDSFDEEDWASLNRVVAAVQKGEIAILD